MSDWAANIFWTSFAISMSVVMMTAVGLMLFFIYDTFKFVRRIERNKK